MKSQLRLFDDIGFPGLWLTDFKGKVPNEP